MEKRTLYCENLLLVGLRLEFIFQKFKRSKALYLRYNDFLI